ncbi:hypothetical protein [Noviherbaspirillum sp. ST9]|uniref:hypothetical protein n=1 Tax=Noviherbaspirillum sp. ST9 TaxID=3401606 RepID=UPI003B58A447
MTLSADFRTTHGAVLRNVSSADAGNTLLADQAASYSEPAVLPRVETRIFTVFPERTARVKAELRDSFRRKMCLIGMCAPTSVFLALAAWYVAL